MERKTQHHKDVTDPKLVYGIKEISKKKPQTQVSQRTWYDYSKVLRKNKVP